MNSLSAVFRLSAFMFRNPDHMNSLSTEVPLSEFIDFQNQNHMISENKHNTYICTQCTLILYATKV